MNSRRMSVGTRETLSSQAAVSDKPDSGRSPGLRQPFDAACANEGSLTTTHVTPVRETRSRSKLTTASIAEIDGIADCPFSFAVREAPLIFSVESPAFEVRLPFRDLGLPITGGLTHRVITHFRRQPDLTEPGRFHDEIAFEWSARSRWLPDLHGCLRFRIATAQTRVILVGEYVPPFGFAGAFFDRLVGRRLARATASDLVDRLARALERRWTTQRRAIADGAG
jgi:hypothetical protein